MTPFRKLEKAVWRIVSAADYSNQPITVNCHEQLAIDCKLYGFDTGWNCVFNSEGWDDVNEFEIKLGD